MKKYFLLIPVIMAFVILCSCSDDTTSSTKKNVIISYEKIQKNDTLILNFTYQDTAYTFLDTAIMPSYDTVPKVIYEVRATDGYADFILYDFYDTNIYSKHFTGYAGNTAPLDTIPYRYIFRTNGFTGTGTIKVVR